MPRCPLAWLVLLLPALAACASPAVPAGAPPAINAAFLAPDLDLAAFVERFEGESREIAVQHAAIVAATGLRPGDRVADIGAGTGLFLAAFSRAVGPRGSVAAVDISPVFVEHLARRAADEGLANVRAALCTERSVQLPPESVDLVFVCDTYHHFEHPQDTLASIRRALRPGGLLVIVDFERVPGVSRDWVLEHVRCGKDVVLDEVGAAGFTLLDEPRVPGLVENYVLRWRHAR